MKFVMETQDIDSLAERVAERLLDRLRPALREAGPPSDQRLCSIKDAARILSRGSWAVRHMIREGKLPCIRDGKRIFVERASIERWIEEQKRESN